MNCWFSVSLHSPYSTYSNTPTTLQISAVPTLELCDWPQSPRAPLVKPESLTPKKMSCQGWGGLDGFGWIWSFFRGRGGSQDSRRSMLRNHSPRVRNFG